MTKNMQRRSIRPRDWHLLHQTHMCQLKLPFDSVSVNSDTSTSQPMGVSRSAGTSGLRFLHPVVSPHIEFREFYESRGSRTVIPLQHIDLEKYHT